MLYVRDLTDPVVDGGGYVYGFWLFYLAFIVVTLRFTFAMVVADRATIGSQLVLLLAEPLDLQLIQFMW